MCTTCGCSDDAVLTMTSMHDDHNHDHDHHHDHDHSHHDHDHSHHGHDHSHHAHDHSHHDHDHSRRHAEHPTAPVTISIEERLLAKNDLAAEQNRAFLVGHGIFAADLVSSPGSGKTSLLERTIKDLKEEITFTVVEGDQATLNDAKRIQQAGCRVVQINTGAGCHLEANMVSLALQELTPPKNSILFIENVGNLVCPALFELGEHCKVVILSVTEGEDKPLKYPYMFRAAKAMILNKIDLLPYLDFPVDECISNAKAINPDLQVFQVSVRNGEGLSQWYDWLRANLTRSRSSASF